ncbi:hypothetical protein B296_00030652 [Ensete ventricosum]|uniref:FAD-binding PCMH-type domain-containing protein n=1 Tax=Ensete ventricosum TaxID=4639 RepID=A0A426ZPS1_ENSVE|nr:hypothetical protein B296_00030652 [Ensete ventricosum]
MHVSDPSVASSLESLRIDGNLSFHDVSLAARDFGNRYRLLPSAVLHPSSAADVAATVRHVFRMGSGSKLTVAARGHGHSLQGQAQADGGIVVRMEKLPGCETKVHDGEQPYVDASGGALWFNVLLECLKHGLAPKSWTDYLHLTVGGTLSNAGISGQAFRHGPQISNVHLLEIVTEDQEMLIALKETFDYIEGFVIINRTGLLNNWRSSFNPENPVQASKFDSDGRILFCLEMTKNFDQDNAEIMNQVKLLHTTSPPMHVRIGSFPQVSCRPPPLWLQQVEALLSKLRYIPSTLFQSEVSYLEFLDRVHVSEVKLRSKGLWEVPHPWLNLLIPRTRIRDFAAEIFGKILPDSNNGPILLYPLNKSK